MPTPSEFPLFILPLIALNQILRLMTPFEIVSLSFCSKKSKHYCSSMRTKAQCEKNSGEFMLYYSFGQGIRMTFSDFPSTQWTFYVMRVSEPTSIITRLRNRIHSFLRPNVSIRPNGSYTELMNNLFISTFHPTERQNECTEYSLRLSPSIDQVSTIKAFILHLEDLFNAPLKKLNLDIAELEESTASEVADCFFRTEGKQLKFFTLKNRKEIGNMNKELIKNILKRQNATHILKMAFNPSAEFNFEIQNLQSKLLTLEIEYSHWVTVNQIINTDIHSLIFNQSKLLKEHFIQLIETWKTGWTPKWSQLEIELMENVNIDECMRSILSEADYDETTCQIKIQSVELCRFVKEKTTSQGISHTIGYYVRRSDLCTATFSVERNTKLWIHIWSESMIKQHSNIFDEHSGS